LANRVPRGLAPWRAGLGPAGPLAQAATSWRLAQAALRLGEDGFVVADEHLTAILLREGGPIAERLAARRLEPLRELTPKARKRMEATGLAYVRHGGNAAAMARELHVHPQTARYRIARLRELVGDALDDPDSRRELELALLAAG
jgi:DNA-binding PucR family transcriptional regulator